jgi:hypothetical protein
MAKLSSDELNEIVARVTARVLQELKTHEEVVSKAGEIRLPLRDATKLGDEVSWAPWIVALPTNVKQRQRSGGSND